mmetsp:Transcript_63831/g.172255  ORF Transcript_63831/g.172255 Transcript_63831/m.172255 type:complete len:231 (-) Transcript_63831:8-700(-)
MGGAYRAVLHVVDRGQEGGPRLHGASRGGLGALRPQARAVLLGQHLELRHQLHGHSRALDAIPQPHVPGADRLLDVDDLAAPVPVGPATEAYDLVPHFWGEAGRVEAGAARQQLIEGAVEGDASEIGVLVRAPLEGVQALRNGPEHLVGGPQAVHLVDRTLPEVQDCPHVSVENIEPCPHRFRRVVSSEHQTVLDLGGRQPGLQVVDAPRLRVQAPADGALDKDKVGHLR